jgi:hypothetical protein
MIDCTARGGLGGALFLIQGVAQMLDCCYFARCSGPVIYLFGASYHGGAAGNFSMFKSSFIDCPLVAAGYPSLVWQRNFLL